MNTADFFAQQVGDYPDFSDGCLQKLVHRSPVVSVAANETSPTTPVVLALEQRLAPCRRIDGIIYPLGQEIQWKVISKSPSPNQ